jgi:hypothetical protein
MLPMLTGHCHPGLLDSRDAIQEEGQEDKMTFFQDQPEVHYR